MTPEDVGIKPNSLKVGVHQGRVVLGMGSNTYRFDPQQALLLASLLIQNSVKAMVPPVVDEAVNKVYGENVPGQN